jgi:RNA polymerase sigma factor (sigma-70 family)
LASDDEAASLAALYLRNRQVMMRAAYAILRNRHDAEDAVSAAVVKVAARLAGGHPVGDPDAYLIQSVRNAALDQLRASVRRRGNQAGNPPGSDTRYTTADSELPADVAEAAPDIADQIIERQHFADLRAAVQRIVDGLAEREATMLSLLLAGHTRAEIGARFNLTGQRVGQLLKLPIADLLGQLGVDPPDPRQQRPAGDRG